MRIKTVFDYPLKKVAEMRDNQQGFTCVQGGNIRFTLQDCKGCFLGKHRHYENGGWCKKRFPKDIKTGTGRGNGFVMYIHYRGGDRQ